MPIRLATYHPFGNSAASYSRVIVPELPAANKYTVRNAVAVCIADPGDAQTLTLTGDSVTLGVLLFGSSIAAGAVAGWTADATNGDHELPAGTVLLLTGSATGDAVALWAEIELDEHARPA